MPSAASSVSVVLTCFNEGDYIRDTIDSVLRQTAASQIVDIVIADDGSNEATLEVLRQIEGLDSRIKVLYGRGGAGLAKQRNWAVSHSTGAWIAFLDGDDLWVAEKLQCQLDAARAVPCDLVYTDYYVFPNHDLNAARRGHAGDISGAGGPALVTRYFLNDPPVVPSTMIVARTAFERHQGFAEDLRVFEDTDFLVRLAADCRFLMVNEPLILKRFHTRSITGGRKDLLAHHALVAFRAAVRTPALMPLVPSRLAERARKLGNHYFLFGDDARAVAHLQAATRLKTLSPLNWLTYLAVRYAPQLTRTVFASALQSRRAALGCRDPL